MKRPASWLVLLTVLASLAVATAGVVPHGDDDQSCLVCKVRQQPLQEQSGMLALEGPPSAAFGALLFEAFELRSHVVGATASRAPPA
ncbi:MAG: hypothetical protein ACRD21_13895 [Vicinamibacteria bacterium]